MSEPVEALLRAAMVDAMGVFVRGVSQWRDKRPVGEAGGVDLVTEADLLVDRLVTDGLGALYPGVPVISEEGEQTPEAQAGDCFVLDPIDGTHNFAAGMPWWGISLARVHGDELLEAWILEAPSATLWHATRGGTATREGQTIRVTDRPSKHCVASVGLSQEVVPILLRSDAYSGVRVLGSHALSLAWSSAGRFGLHAGRGHPWDVAAGYLILERAGGRICRFDGDPRPLWSRDHALTGAPQAVDTALEILNP
jgi:myo-inositol-1(or 4)-monophosphatase